MLLETLSSSCVYHANYDAMTISQATVSLSGSNTFLVDAGLGPVAFIQLNQGLFDDSRCAFAVTATWSFALLARVYTQSIVL